jgi:beta-galactosidase
MNGDWGRGFSKVIDVQGCNYRTENIDPFHAAHPGQPVIGTETASTVTTRGIYADEPARGYVSAYGDQYPPWAAAPWDWWSYYAVRPYLAGGFAWTGFDYRGEPTPYAWPCVNSHFGILDTCGFPKDIYYYYQSWWTDQPVLHLAPHWSWPHTKGQEVLVRCFSNCDEVELFLNGKSLGKQAMKPNSYLDWKVAFAPGTLLAKGWRGGREVAEDKVETTGKPAALRLVPDRATLNADGADVSLVTVEVLDAKGRVVPIADNLVKFALSGSGHILGVGNGDPSCHESDQTSQRSAFNGRALVIVQSAKTAGPIRLTAESAGLTPITLTLQAQACVLPPAVP